MVRYESVWGGLGMRSGYETAHGGLGMGSGNETMYTETTSCQYFNSLRTTTEMQ